MPAMGSESLRETHPSWDENEKGLLIDFAILRSRDTLHQEVVHQSAKSKWKTRSRYDHAVTAQHDSSLEPG